MSNRYLTKSRFKIGLECPTKLYYEGNKEYANQNIEDSFLLALAEGGFQVGELAKYYYAGGHMIGSLDYAEALAETNKLLQKDRVIIYEAAVQQDNFFVRTDILIKDNNQIKLIEVKAKSVDFASEEGFLNKSGAIISAWSPYLFDVAFQKHVLMEAFPRYKVSAYLMMADKNALCPTDGLNQKFKLSKNEQGRTFVTVSEDLSLEDLTPPILREIQVDGCCDLIYSQPIEPGGNSYSFVDYAKLLSESYKHNNKLQMPISSMCKDCEYRTTEEEDKAGLKNGFRECWQACLGWSDADFADSTVLDIWNFRKKDKLINQGKIKLTFITEDDISPKEDDKPGLSTTERQWLQVQKEQNDDQTAWCDTDNLKEEMDSWLYPLHFIDFETSMVAIPFNKGRHPYEGIAFQFSHHVVYEGGHIEHKGEYLNTAPGVFPNYEFVRKLKAELETDEGSVFRYAAHENSFLNIIYKQLKNSDESDREELCAFIQTITHSVNGSEEKWTGERDMIDMCELVKRYYYNPATNGSNSIKYVLPAILNSSEFLQKKYSQPIYGAKDGIASHNYQNWTWIEFKDGKVIDPYKLLPNMFQDVDNKDFELLNGSDEIRDGGAALTAYAKMQFEEMSDVERNEIRKALLKYCELDTFAMVMIYEGWKDLTG